MIQLLTSFQFHGAQPTGLQCKDTSTNYNDVLIVYIL